MKDHFLPSIAITTTTAIASSIRVELDIPRIPALQVVPLSVIPVGHTEPTGAPAHGVPTAVVVPFPQLIRVPDAAAIAFAVVAAAVARAAAS